jgi:hypothetical protein
MTFQLRKCTALSFKILLGLVMFIVSVVLVNSAMDVYNNFAYDKAILKDTPYGWTPLLRDPQNYSSGEGTVLSGEFVYVEDWLSAYNQKTKIAFAKVRSKLKEGYVNRDLLVETNINVKPILSVLLLLGVFSYSIRKLFIKFRT